MEVTFKVEPAVNEEGEVVVGDVEVVLLHVGDVEDQGVDVLHLFGQQLPSGGHVAKGGRVDPWPGQVIGAGAGSEYANVGKDNKMETNSKPEIEILAGIAALPHLQNVLLAVECHHRVRFGPGLVTVVVGNLVEVRGLVAAAVLVVVSVHVLLLVVVGAVVVVQRVTSIEKRSL